MVEQDKFLNMIGGSTETIADTGEDGVLELIRKVFPKELIAPDSLVIPALLDDAAVLSGELLSDDEELVVTSDVLVEGADFLFDWMSYFDLGYKSLIVNLSDLAAMGANPIGMVVVVGLPDSTPIMQLESFLEGLKKAAEEYSVILLGGDLSESKSFFCNITLLGKVPKGKALARGGVKENDCVAVTGYPGEARAGLMILQSKVSNVKSDERSLVDSFFMPKARIDAGIVLREFSGIRGCIDLSDGIARDASRIAKRNNLRVIINAENLPVSERLDEFWKSRGENPQKETAIGGEDFELMFCCESSRFDEIKKLLEDKLKLTVTLIGRVTSGEGAALVMPDSSEIEMATWGFDHFDKSEERI